MNQSDKTLMRRLARTAAIVVALAAGLACFAVSAATSQTIGTGTMQYSEAIGGPATLTMRTLTIAPGEVLGWHHHPGIGAYTVVVSGTLTVEDGCGGAAVYSQGQAFLEAPYRVHRGKNLTGANVVTAQTLLVPLGTPTSVSHAQRMCGVPLRVEECKKDGWRAFNFPSYFMTRANAWHLSARAADAYPPPSQARPGATARVPATAHATGSPDSFSWAMGRWSGRS